MKYGALLMAIGTAIACVGEDTGWLTMDEFAFVAPEGSGEPNISVGGDGRIWLSWFEPTPHGDALRVTHRSGGEWAEPITVAMDRAFFVNWADFPSVVETGDGTVFVHWLEKVAESPYAYHVMLVRSTDRGRTWSDPVPAHDDLSPTEHGFVAMLPAGDRVALSWLDGQNTTGEGEHRGAMTVRFRTVRSDGTFDPDVLLDARVCDCCNTDMVSTPSGLVVAYRDRSESEIRDIAITRFVDGEWTAPYHVGEDHWYFPACPVNGPALTNRGDSVAIAWFAAPDQASRVQVAFSDDGAASFGDAIPVHVGEPLGRVDVEMLPDGSAVAVWLERRDADGVVVTRRIYPDGRRSSPVDVTPTSQARRSGFPRLARTGDELVFAWTLDGEAGGVRVASARIH